MLVTSVIFSAFHGGLIPGLCGAVIALGFAAINLSIPDQLFHYTHIDLLRLFSFAYILPAEAWITEFLKNRLTERGLVEKKFPNQMIASAKTRVMGDLASNVAHDINSQLTLISVHSGQLKHSFTENQIDLELAQEMIEQIDHSVGKITRVTQSLRLLVRNLEHDPFQEVKIKEICENRGHNRN